MPLQCGLSCGCRKAFLRCFASTVSPSALEILGKVGHGKDRHAVVGAWTQVLRELHSSAERGGDREAEAEDRPKDEHRTPPTVHAAQHVHGIRKGQEDRKPMVATKAGISEALCKTAACSQSASHQGAGLTECCTE
eukprot:CAMPEP_0171279798 /NCGR_PEP_ID=MMETSP0790-20130122/65571_1 /TAXON_ID=2925 /ORGANISM="Alexandrium catenella, Strain OF101" /LENGTH=135 /DNA_ID=CAMNT_0011748999 /DNA_START=37 /DNA_END=444 /DNA_ORIENTATION=+